MSTLGAQTTISFGNQSTHQASNSWTVFANVTEITPPSLEADDVETSHMTTPNQIRTFIPGWAESSDGELVLEFSASEARKVYDLFRVPKGFCIDFPEGPTPSGSKLKFNGYIKSVGTESPFDGLITMPVTIKISGAPVFDDQP